ncbi:phenylalanine--tRNA ligase subunit beta [Candidatus Falkowbacteria bacterium]|nr:phenylalanine--tRNA ligase subunit beta [Candidatus Falkowbacteria bacterium]
MQLSYNWLKDFVKIPKKMTAEELGVKLSLHTVEVEKIEKQGTNLKDVVVGEILEIKKHRSADKLYVSKVDVGEKKPRQIIFGQMAEMKVGYKVPVALAPTILPQNKEIKRAEIRGEISEGMLCLDQESGLLKEGVSIHFFDKKVKNGTLITKALEFSDIIFEIDNKSLSNRPDLWCHYGMAREIAAIADLKLKPFAEIAKMTAENLDEEGKKNASINLKVKVEDQKLCPRYMAVAMSGVKVVPSPAWMQKRLVAAGTRPINNIVDITNYVMLELGQPLHAFDFNKISGMKIPNSKSQIPNKFQIQNSNIQKIEVRIIVRKARRGEVIETLDGEERKLDEEMLVIANEEKPLAIAGVMGGAGSEINPETETIIIESANFDAVSVRKTSGRIGLRTESSMRFEKSLDLNLCETALARTVELIKEICQEAKVTSGLSDIRNFTVNQGPLELDLEWIVQKIGQKIPTKDVISILRNLGFGVAREWRKLSVVIPTWRAAKDISITEDVVEEIARIYGYEKIISAMPKTEMAAPEVNEERVLERKIKEILSNASVLTEVYNYSFVGDDELRKLNIDSSDYVGLANPIASNLNLLRQSLAPGLFANVRLNQNRFAAIGVFEIGSVFFSFSGDVNKDAKREEFLPYQEKRLGIVLAGEGNLFSKIKGVLEYLFLSLELDILFKEAEIKPTWADVGICATVAVNNKEIGIVGKINSKTGRSFGLKKEAVSAEINLKQFLDVFKARKIKIYKPIEKYPAVSRDLAFVVSDKILYNEIKAAVIDFAGFIKKAELFDVYQGEKLGKGKRSLAFHLIYQADRTLTAEEVDEVQKKLTRHLEEKMGAKIRDF